MGDQILTKYLVTCIPEGIRVVTDYIETLPTVCPNNNSHAIDPTKTIVIDTVEPNIVSINQSAKEFTDGSFRVKYYNPSFSPGITYFDFDYNYPVAIYSTTIIPTTENIGDNLDVLTAPDTIVGIISNNLNIGAVELAIGDTSPVFIGYRLSITDGVNTNDLGEVIGKDDILNTLKFTNVTTNNFLLSTPSYVMITVPRIENLMLKNTSERVLGNTILDAATLPKGVKIRLRYTNNGATVKTLCFSVDIKIIKSQE